MGGSKKSKSYLDPDSLSPTDRQALERAATLLQCSVQQLCQKTMKPGLPLGAHESSEAHLNYLSPLSLPSQGSSPNQFLTNSNPILPEDMRREIPYGTSPVVNSTQLGNSSGSSALDVAPWGRTNANNSSDADQRLIYIYGQNVLGWEGPGAQTQSMPYISGQSRDSEMQITSGQQFEFDISDLGLSQSEEAPDEFNSGQYPDTNSDESGHFSIGSNYWADEPLRNLDSLHELGTPASNSTSDWEMLQLVRGVVA